MFAARVQQDGWLSTNKQTNKRSKQAKSRQPTNKRTNDDDNKQFNTHTHTHTHTHKCIAIPFSFYHGVGVGVGFGIWHLAFALSIGRWVLTTYRSSPHARAPSNRSPHPAEMSSTFVAPNRRKMHTVSEALNWVHSFITLYLWTKTKTQEKQVTSKYQSIKMQRKLKFSRQPQDSNRKAIHMYDTWWSMQMPMPMPMPMHLQLQLVVVVVVV